MITWLVIAFVVLIVVGKTAGSINKSVQKMQGKNKCGDCGSRLKAVNGVYKPVCPKCGSRQSWAP